MIDFKIESFKNLVDLKKILVDAGINYWIDCGLLLGLYREGDMIKGDEKDIDVGISYKDADKLKNLIPEFKKNNFRIKKDPKLEDGSLVALTIKRNSIIDIHIYREKDNEVYFPMYIKRIPKLKVGVYIHPAYLFETLGEIEWNGVKFPCPKNIDAYLVNRYGRDWYINKIETGEWKGPKCIRCNPCLEIWDEEKFGKIL